MKKWIILIVAAVVVLGAVTGVIIYNNQPKVVVRNALMNAFDNLFERDEIEPVAKMLEKGSLEVSANVDASTLDLFFGSGVGSIKAGGKLYFSDDALMLQNLNVKMGDFKLGTDAYIGEDLIYVTNAEILGGSWGAIRGEMAGTLEDSLIVDWFKLNGRSVEILERMLESYDDGKDKELKKDLEKQITKYIKVAVKAIEKNADYDAENKKVKIGGEKVSARVIDVTIDGRAMAGILEYIYDEMKDDKELRRTVVAYLEDYEDWLRDRGVISEDEDASDLYKEFMNTFGEFVDYMDEVMGESDAELIVRVATAKASSKLMQLTVIEDNGANKSKLFTLDIGKKGIKKSEQLSLTLGEYTTYTYKIKENDSKEYTAELKAAYGEDHSETLFKVSVDKKDDTFKLVIGEVTLSGDFISKGKTTTITLNKIKAGDVTVKDFELSLIIKEKDKMPKPVDKSDVKNILEITEKDIEEMVKKAEELDFGFSGGADIEDWADAVLGGGSVQRPADKNEQNNDGMSSDNGYNDDGGYDNGSSMMPGFGFDTNGDATTADPEYSFGGSNGATGMNPGFGFNANSGTSAIDPVEPEHSFNEDYATDTRETATEAKDVADGRR